MIHICFSHCNFINTFISYIDIHTSMPYTDLHCMFIYMINLFFKADCHHMHLYSHLSLAFGLHICSRMRKTFPWISQASHLSLYLSWPIGLDYFLPKEKNIKYGFRESRLCTTDGTLCGILFSSDKVLLERMSLKSCRNSWVLLIYRMIKKRMLIWHPIKLISFVQFQNCTGFYKYSLGDARC